MKVAVITDTHFGARNDSVLFHDYFDLFYQNVFFPYLKKNNITTLLHLGDLMDRRKYVNFTTLSRVRRGFIEPLAKMGVETHITIGNHDVYFKNTNEINSVSELFCDVPNFHIYTSPEVINIDGLDILLMPWMATDTVERDLQILNSSKAPIVAGHLEFDGFEMYRGITCDHGLAKDVVKKYHMVMTGHFHHKSSIDNIHYLGSPYEITFADMNDYRGFHILDTETLDLSFVPNPYHMFYRLVYDDKGKESDEVLGERMEQLTDRYVKIVVSQKTNPYLFDRFLDKVYAVGPADVTTVEDFTIGMQEEEGEETDDVKLEDTISVLNKYVEAINIDINKDRLKRVLAELYSEALALEMEGEL